MVSNPSQWISVTHSERYWKREKIVIGKQWDCDSNGIIPEMAL
jgi:hypothetical protein